MTATMSWGLVCGVVLGFGLWSLLSLVPRLSRPRLVDRVAPYVVDISVDARELVRRRPTDPLPVVGVVLVPAVDAMRRLLAPVLGGSAVVQSRLRQAGSTLSVDGYRSRQLGWGAAGAVVGVAASVVIARAQGLALPAAVAIVAVFAACGVLLRDRMLVARARRRRERMAEELPTILEFLTLSLSAGEGIHDALARVATVGRGELAVELRRTMARVHSGVPLVEALQALAADLGLAGFSRFVDHLVGALERGTPLAEVLRAQAQDARDEGKRELLELAGRKEVAMLVPLVFLILPVTVLFAIYPGLVVVQLGF
ncbi:type II secretion system F family protein [Diaminobutyricimonas aerilata]|nr:type II secretion system F family protein [Diaminobutyricimonas aerilata]